MKLDPDLQNHLRQVRLPSSLPEGRMPDGFVSRLLATRAAKREREKAVTGTMAVAAGFALAVLVWAGLRGPSEPACLGWLEMESVDSTTWE